MGGGRQDHYDVLGVSPGAPDEVIRAAYRALAAKCHPDRNPGDREAELKLKKLNAAFRVLGDPATRSQYDELTRSPDDHTSKDVGAETGELDVSVSEPKATDSQTAPANDPPPLFRTCSNCGAEGKREALRCHRCLVKYNEPSKLGRSPLEEGGGSVNSTTEPKGILATILKVAGYLFLAFVVIIGCLSWYAKTQDDEQRAERAAVTIDANYDVAACPQNQPILVVIANGSQRTLKSVAFALQAFEKGRSDDLALDSTHLESTVILHPGGISRTCWKFPTLKRNAAVFFQADKYYETFYENDESVPGTGEAK